MYSLAAKMMLFGANFSDLARRQSAGEPGAWCGNAVDHSCDGGFCSSVAYSLDGRPSSRFRAALGRTVWLPLCFRQLSRQQAIPAAAKGACTRRHSGEAYAAAGALASALAAAYLDLKLRTIPFPYASADTGGSCVSFVSACAFTSWRELAICGSYFAGGKHMNSRGRSIPPLSTSRSSTNHS